MNMSFVGPSGKVLQATARVPHQTTWLLRDESGFTSVSDNNLRLNQYFEDVEKLGKDLAKWMRCGQQVELNEKGIVPQDPGMVY